MGNLSAPYTGWRGGTRSAFHSERPERLNPARRSTAKHALSNVEGESGEERSGGSHGTYQDRRGHAFAAQNESAGVGAYPLYWKRPPILSLFSRLFRCSPSRMNSAAEAIAGLLSPAPSFSAAASSPSVCFTSFTYSDAGVWSPTSTAKPALNFATMLSSSPRLK